jgi:hypothetical protein
VISDKNSLFDRGRIGEMGLCVKKNKSQYMRGLSYPAARGIGMDKLGGNWVGLKLEVVREYQMVRLHL